MLVGGSRSCSGGGGACLIGVNGPGDSEAEASGIVTFMEGSDAVDVCC